jgi:hypothetical protein
VRKKNFLEAIMIENAPAGSGPDKLPYKLCEHIKDDGMPCGGPALSDETFCRFHVRMRTNVSPEDQLYELPLLETEKSVQIALQHVTRALLAGKLTERKAAVIMSAIKTAAALIRQSNQNAPKEALLDEIANELCGRTMAKRKQQSRSVTDLDQ